MGKWERDPHDWYVEPQWVSWRLFEVEAFDGDILDPACGQGNIVDAAIAAGYKVGARDIVRRTDAVVMSTGDFLDPAYDDKGWKAYANIVTNPPYRHADAFARLSLARTTGKVALLLPATWHLSDKRSRWLEAQPLARIYCLTPRPSMPPGQWLAEGNKAGGGTVDFAWYLMDHAHTGPVETRWLRRDP
jgi:hypothetical protein